MKEEDINEKELRDYDRIDAYLRGEMNKEEEELFLHDIETDDELRERARAMGLLLKGIKAEGEARDRELVDAIKNTDEESLRSIIAQAIAAGKKGEADKEQVKDGPGTATETPISPDGQEREPAKPDPMAGTKEEADAWYKQQKRIALRRKIIRFISAAAMVIILLSVGNYAHNRNLTVSLGQAFAQTVRLDQSVLEQVVRGADDEQVVAELTSLFNNVRNDTDLTASIKRLWQLWETSKQPTANNYTNYMPLIGYSLAVACLEDNDRGGARQVLTELIALTDEGTYYHQQAQKLMTRIDQL